MKSNKLNIKWIAAAAALGILLLLLLTMCTGKKDAVPAVSAQQPTQSQTEPAQTTAEPTEETTLPTGETTAPTEATTEPTEETKKPSAGSDSSDDDTDIDDSEEDEDEDVTVETEPPLEIPDPGTDENPYVEVLAEYPAAVASVNIPKGKSISYRVSGSAGTILTIEDPHAAVVYDGKTCAADENGIVTLDLTKTAADPVIRFSNTGEEETSYLVTFTEGPGGKTNPVLLSEETTVDVALEAGNAKGIYYQWTAPEKGTLTLTTETEGLEITAFQGEQEICLPESGEKTLTLNVVKEEQILIHVAAKPDEAGMSPELTGTFGWEFQAELGTALNPQVLETLEAVEVALEAGDADGYHYLWTAPVDGTLTMTAEGIELIAGAGETVCKLSESENGTLVMALKAGDKVLLQAIAVPDEEGTYPEAAAAVTGGFVPDTGTALAPELLETLDISEITLAAADADGYHYQWTAPENGTLTASVTAVEPEGASCEIILTGTVTGNTARLSESTDGSACVALKQQEPVLIQLLTLPDETGALPEAKITLKAVFAEAPGSSPENPLVITDVTAATTVSVDAEDTVYISGPFRDMIATIENAADASMICEGVTAPAARSGLLTLEFPAAGAETDSETVLFELTSKTRQEYILTFAYPVGHGKNPAPLVLGHNEASLAEDDADGYLFTWTADCDGQLTVSFAETGNWQYALHNLTAGTAGALHTSAEDPRTASEMTEVKTGEVLQIMVNTWASGDDQSTPAGKVAFEASFFDPLLGTEAKPIMLDASEDAVNTVTIPAGRLQYYTAPAAEMDMTLTGKNVMVILNGLEHIPENGLLELPCGDEPPVFQLANSNTWDQTCKISFAYPAGHRNNPEPLTLGENTAELEAGSGKGHVFSWTADTAGELTITMAKDTNWQYTAENKTAAVPAAVHTSGDETLCPVQILPVNKGDVVLVTVNTYDPETPDIRPGGTVMFTASFMDPTLGTQENPIRLEITDTLTIPAGQTLYYAAKADGMTMTLHGTDVSVVHNGLTYIEEAGAVEVPCKGEGIFAVTNTGKSDGVFTVAFAYPAGHSENPIELTLGLITADIAASNGDGICYLWTAEADGALTVAMDGKGNWQYAVSNLTTGVSGNLNTSGSEVPVYSETVAVKAGDEIRIFVNLLDPSDPSGGSVVFHTEFLSTETEETEETICEDPA